MNQAVDEVERRMDQVLRRCDRMESELLRKLQRVAVEMQQRRAPPLSIPMVCLITAIVTAWVMFVTVAALKVLRVL